MLSGDGAGAGIVAEVAVVVEDVIDSPSTVFESLSLLLRLSLFSSSPLSFAAAAAADDDDVVGGLRNMFSFVSRLRLVPVVDEEG